MNHVLRKVLRVELFIVAAGLIFASTPAQAHDPSTYYQYKWKGDLLQGYRFVEPWPGTTSFRNRIRDGLSQWNALNQSLKFASLGEADWPEFDPFNPCAQAYGRNGIHWKNIGTPGVTPYCPKSTTEMKNAQMVIDSQPTYKWWQYTTTPAADRLDLRSVATHEWGHMFSRVKGGYDDKGHWNPCLSCTLCPTDYGDGFYDRHTMCPSLSPGTWSMGVLHTHDAETFKLAY